MILNITVKKSKLLEPLELSQMVSRTKLALNLTEGWNASSHWHKPRICSDHTTFQGGSYYNLGFRPGSGSETTQL